MAAPGGLLRACARIRRDGGSGGTKIVTADRFLTKEHHSGIPTPTALKRAAVRPLADRIVAERGSILHLYQMPLLHSVPGGRGLKSTA